MAKALARCAVLAVLVIFGLSLPMEAEAGGFSLRWVEADVVLDKDGKAQVSYAVRWKCRGANFHGFYFKGFQEDPAFDYANADARQVS